MNYVRIQCNDTEVTAGCFELQLCDFRLVLKAYQCNLDIISHLYRLNGTLLLGLTCENSRTT